MTVANAVGIDVGGSKLVARSVGDGPELRVQRPTGRATSPPVLLAAIQDVTHALRADGAKVDAVGLGFPGLVDAERGVVRSSVMLEGWRDQPLATMVAEATGLPCTIDNDVNAAAVAELAARAASPPACMMLVAVGTGIGGAIALGGSLWRGAAGLAGEIGNTTIAVDGETCWCGRRGCLNVLCSGTAIERQLGIGAGELARAAQRPESAAVLQRAAEHLATGLVNAMHLLGPDLIVLGGGVLELGEPFVAAVREEVRRQAFAEMAAVCRIEASHCGYDAAAIGAGLQALQALEARER